MCNENKNVWGTTKVTSDRLQRPDFDLVAAVDLQQSVTAANSENHPT